MADIRADRDEFLPSDHLIHLSAGFFSTVYAIKNSELVLKIPNPEALPLHTVEKRIYQRLKGSPHANILPYFGERKIRDSPDSTIDVGLCFEFQAYGTLSDFLNSSCRPWDHEDLKYSWHLQLASALACIHCQGIIHGDIGLHNILIGSQKSLFLCDFGGSRLNGSKCLAFPSARYRRTALPIEQREDYSPNKEDDIFALGVVIYEIETGQQLWKELSHPEILYNITHEHLPAFDGIHPSLGNVIRACWTGSYADAEGLLNELEKMELSGKTCQTT